MCTWVPCSIREFYWSEQQNKSFNVTEIDLPLWFADIISVEPSDSYKYISFVG